LAASASWISLYRWGVGASCRLRHVTRFAGGPFFPRREAAVLGPALVTPGCEAVVLEAVAPFETPVLEGAGRKAVALGAVAPFATPAFEGAAFLFFAADAAGFVTVFLAAGAVVFLAGVVLSALQPSAASAAMPAQHRMVRMPVVQFTAARRLARAAALLRERDTDGTAGPVSFFVAEFIA